MRMKPITEKLYIGFSSGVHFLLLNVKKTKEMIIDFRRNKNPLTPVLINNEVECVESYKYLGVTLDNVLNWNSHVMTLLKKLNT